MARKNLLAVLIVILLIGFGLRVLNLGQQSLWYDEAYSVFYARAGLQAIAGQQQADPLPYFLALWGWIKLAGFSEYAVRYLSVVLGTLTIPLIYQILRAAGARRLGLIAAGTLTVSAFHIYYSQEARLHIVAGLLAALIIYALIQAIRHGGSGRWCAYALAAAAGMYSYYYLLLLLFGLNAALLVCHARSRAWLVANASALVVALPGLVLAYRRVTAFNEPYIPPIGPPLADFPSFVLVGSAVDRLWTLPLLALVVVLALLAIWTVARGGNLIWRMLLGGFLVPAVGVFAIPAALGQFTHPRYEIVALPALLALLLWSWRRCVARARWLWPISAACLLAPTGISLLNGYTNPSYQRDDNREALALIRQDALPDEVLIYDLPLQYDVLDYYGRDLAIPSQALPVPKNRDLPRDRQFVPETSDRPATEQRLSQLASQYSGAWLLLSGDPVQWTEDWLDANRVPVLNRWFGRTRLKHYRPLPGPDVTMPDGRRVAKGFGPLQLGQAKVGDLEPGKLWPVYLLWRVSSPPPADLTVSAQLFDASRHRLAQLDSQPFNGVLPTSQWVVGSNYQDTMLLPLPATLQPGAYDLELSVYDARGLVGQQGSIMRIAYGSATGRSLDAAADAGWTVEVVRLGSDASGKQLATLEGNVQRPPPADYTWFVHLLDASGRLLSQDDHPPLATTSSWRPGDRFSEVFILAGASSGVEIEIGAYDAAGRRVSFKQGAGPASDHLELPL